MSSSINSNVLPSIFREYIGVKPYPDTFTDFPVDIINPKVKEFHFILGFATEDHDDKGKGTGNFKKTWNVEYFNAEKIKRMKDSHPKVKVVISIGGRGSQLAFNPAEPLRWIDNAKSSLKEIIQDYNERCSFNLIDGIDIYYEIIQSSENEFATCIGEVIKGLKMECGQHFTEVSIAPSALVQAHYYRLYQSYRNDIKWVDYQFSDQTVSSKSDFESLYRRLSDDYKEKLLAGFSTDPDDPGKISQEDFLQGCKDLINSNLLPGIFCWNANDSAVPPPGKPPFLFEIMAQRLLVHQD